MTKRAAIWLLVMAVVLTTSCVFGTVLTVKHAHGELNLTGLIQTYYAMYENDNMSDTFAARRVRLGVDGNVYEKIFFLIELETSTSGNPLRDAYITLKYIPHVDLRVGQFFKPVLYEALTSTRKLPFIQYSLPTVYMFSNNVADRDIGVQATFHLEKEDYTFLLLQAGVFNGTGMNKRDNNDQKDWVMRASVQPVKGIKVFGSYTYGTYGDKLNENAVYVSGSKVFGHEPYQEYSAGFAIDYQGLDFAGEWIGMNTRYLPSVSEGLLDASGPPPVDYSHERSWDMYGFYTYLGYKIDTGHDYFHQVEPIVRYAYLDPDINSDRFNDLQRTVTYGLNVAIDKHFARLQLNYVQNLNDSCTYEKNPELGQNASPYGKQADNVFLAQLQVAF
ncbi:MAG: hypothetical protein DRH70_06080 [Candidatus Coatesbacteria bacterium]|nr:MAG: hypothetical protein DRH70_06080 [Candidatus Coatesbacteria bacterium]